MPTRTDSFLLPEPYSSPPHIPCPWLQASVRYGSVPCCLTAEFWAPSGAVLSDCHLAGPGGVSSLFLDLKSPLSGLLEKSAKERTMKNILHMWQLALVLVLSFRYSKVKPNIIPRIFLELDLLRQKSKWGINRNILKAIWKSKQLGTITRLAHMMGPSQKLS